MIRFFLVLPCLLLPAAAAAANLNNLVTTNQQPPVLKILVCGDSITQGADGDFTWRYRLWEWFRQQQEDENTETTTTMTTTTTPTLHFVGPYTGTLPAGVADAIDLADPQTNGTYHPAVDPAFYPGGGSSGSGGNSAHFAVYGRPAWLDVDLIAAQVAAARPDVVVLHLGFNDIGWWAQTAAELLASIRALVDNARLGRPDMRILIADVSHRVLVPGREDIPRTTDAYNALLRKSVVGWSTEQSPVWVVKVSEDYDCHVEACPAGKDGIHPNALGDYQIARAYTKVLHDKLRLGAAPLVVPPLEAIPGFQPPVFGGPTTPLSSSSSSSGSSVFMYPPVGVFVVVSALCLVAVAVVLLRPRLRRRGLLRSTGGGGGGSGGEGKYQLLPTVS